MPQTCRSCNHADREAIDKAILRGEPQRSIALRHGLSASSVRRHRVHIPATIAKAHEAGEIAHGDELLGQVRDLHERTLKILTDAEAEGRPATALSAIREARSTLELLGKMTGQLIERHAHLHAQTGPLIPAEEWSRWSEAMERVHEFEKEDYQRLQEEEQVRKGHLILPGEYKGEGSY